jgi:glycosyltransferase involved in cell wall biosynthesis
MNLRFFDMKTENFKKILFMSPLPPPMTGQSLACQIILDRVRLVFLHVALVNFSRNNFKSGGGSLWRIMEVLKIFLKILVSRRGVNVIYFTNSESVFGNLKDLMIYGICFRQLDRMVIHLHGGAGMRELLSEEHPILHTVNAFFLKRVGAVIVLGERLKGIYSKLVEPSKLYAVPNFALDELFVETEAIEAKFNCVKPIRLLFLSNLLPGKGHQELLAALALLPPEIRDQLHVDFAGGFESADEETKFRKQADAVKVRQLKVHGVVHGQMKRDLLRNAHLFCLPTYYPYEGQPISILEAYASGCAVMTTDHSGIFDTFTPGVNGIEVQPRSPESIAHAIQHALAQPQALKEYARTNLEHARLKYRASTHVEALEKIIYSVANSSTIK